MRCGLDPACGLVGEAAGVDERSWAPTGGPGGGVRILSGPVLNYFCSPLRLRDTVAYRACERELPVEQSQYSECVYICARANHHSYLQRACKCRVQSSGKTKTVLIAAVLAINEVNMSQPAIINQPSSTGRKERKLR